MDAHPNEMIQRYRRLRQILERAYSHRPRNSRRIDLIADALCEIERRLARIGNFTAKAGLGLPGGSPPQSS